MEVNSTSKTTIGMINVKILFFNIIDVFSSELGAEKEEKLKQMLKESGLDLI